jgi:FixJ family two-component response regulator
MPTTVIVIAAPHPDRSWIEAALARSADTDAVFLDDPSSLLAKPPTGRSCVIALADANDLSTLALVRELRSRGSMLPVIVLGSHAAFRTAVEIARFPATDFLERPVSAHQLREAILRACKAAP